MGGLRFLSKIEQVAAFLREELIRGQWSVEMPGKEELAAELGVNAKTVGRAMQMLEKEGLLVPQGSGRRRRIAEALYATTGLRIKILMFDSQDEHRNLRQQLEAAGHLVTIAEKTLMDLNMDAKRVAAYASTVRTSAWIVTAATRDVLEWFSQQAVPAFALFGDIGELPICSVGVDKVPPMRSAIQQLYSLGHRRIVLLARCERRKPHLPRFERAFLEELKSHGITTGPYNLPEWTSDPLDFHRCLNSLFGKTPPTALIVDETPHFLAAQLFVAQRGLVLPRDLSMICLEGDPVLSWCRPMVSHVAWNFQPMANAALTWANRVAAGIREIKHERVSGVLHEGCTIRPVPR